MTTATANKKASQNGTRKKPERPSNTDNPVTTSAVPNAEIERDLSVAQVIAQSSELQHLIEQRNKLVDRRDKLRQFKYKREDTTAILTITDTKGNEFQVAKDNFVNDTVDHMDGLLSTRIDEFSNQILEFRF